MSRFSGIQTYQSYYSPATLRSLAVEPNTNGMLIATPASIIYCDRREPSPKDLYRSALTEEPLYSLLLEYDQTIPGDLRHIKIRPLPLARADQMVQYRFWAVDPDGTHWLITSKGEFAKYQSNGGWFRGDPPKNLSVILPNSQCGTWLFVMECSDHTGHRNVDIYPYLHGAVNPLIELDVTSLVPDLQAVVFDSRERLWLWDGAKLIPAKFRYDAYIYEPDARSVFLTDTYDEVHLL